MTIVEVAAVDFREALSAVRELLERAGSARAVELAELRARRHAIMAVAARGRGFGAELSPDMEGLMMRLATELVDAAEAPAPAPAENERVAAA